MNEKVFAFLQKHGMCRWDSRSAIETFVQHAKSGLEGAASSLLMLPAYLKAEGELPPKEPVIVVDAGGTNLRVALAQFEENGTCSISYETRYPMPGTQGQISAGAFFDALAEAVAPLAGRSSLIGFCFSFPCEIMPDLDGKLLTFNKEVKVTGAAGKMIGVSLIQALRSKGLDQPWRVVILNDTVATMMGGLSQGQRHNCKDFIGLILGTGTNMCCMERCSRITKDPALAAQEGKICINMEAGGYDGFPQNAFDRAVDQTSDKHNYHLFEKMVSGAYQGPYVLYMLQAAAEEGLFSQSAAAAIGSLQELQAADVDAFCREPEGSGVLASLCTPEDRQTMYDCLDAFYDRTAFLIAAAITGVLELTDQGRSPAEPVCVVADGSAFYKPLLFRPKLAKHIAAITRGTYGRHVLFVKSEFGNFEGAAAAALMNR